MAKQLAKLSFGLHQLYINFVLKIYTKGQSSTNLETCEHRHKFIDKCLSKRCDGCRVLLYIKNKFNYKERICDPFYKILLNTEFEPGDKGIIWLNNCKYRVLTNLRRGQAQRLIEREKITDRYGYIDISNMNPNEI